MGEVVLVVVALNNGVIQGSALVVDPADRVGVDAVQAVEIHGQDGLDLAQFQFLGAEGGAEGGRRGGGMAWGRRGSWRDGGRGLAGQVRGTRGQHRLGNILIAAGANPVFVDLPRQEDGSDDGDHYEEQEQGFKTAVQTPAWSRFGHDG